MLPYWQREFSRKSQEHFRLNRHRDCSRTPSARFDDTLRSSVQRIQRKVTTEYQHQVEKLATHPRKSPQNVYHAFTQCIQDKLVSLPNYTRHGAFPTKNRKDDIGKAATCSHWNDRPHRIAMLALLTPSKKWRSQRPLTR